MFHSFTFIVIVYLSEFNIGQNRYRLLKQIQTANICLNVERDCYSVIL